MVFRLSAMMFLQYWPLGTWGVTVGTYIAANTGKEGLGIFSSGFVGYSTAASAIGSMLSPILVGFLSDRYFSAVKLLVAMHLVCGGTAWAMHESHTELAFFCWLLAYYHAFIPTITLTNKIALKHLSHVEREYPAVRTLGTLGWIAAGLFVGLMWPLLSGATIELTATPLLIGTFGHGVIALYALTLPPTPPERAGSQPRSLGQALWAKGSLLKNRPLTVFLLISLFACIPSMVYNNYANLFLNRSGFPNPVALMTLGQVSELFTLLATPWILSRVGLKTLFTVGVFAWATRYGLLTLGAYSDSAWPTVMAILAHGPCYVFIYIVGVMFVDRLVDPDHRGAAQGLIALATLGLGHLTGALLVGFTQEQFLTPDGVAPPPYHWIPFWLVPGVLSLVTAILFRLLFRDETASGHSLQET